MAPSDGQVIVGSVSDPAEFAEIFRRHFAPIFGYLARRVGADIAEDLAAQTFVEAFGARERFDHRVDSARPWLFGIATNLLRHHRRSEVRGWAAYARTGVDPLLRDVVAEDASTRADADTLGPPLARVMAGLSAADRDTLLLYAWAELSYDEVATALGVPVGTVRSRLHRARTILRPALDHVWNEVHDG